MERLAWLQVAYQSRGRGTALCPLDARRVDRRTTAEELEREEVAPGDVAVAARGDDMTERQKDRKAKREREREEQRVYYALNISATRIRCVLSPFCRRRRAALCTVGGHRRPAACLSLSLSLALPSLKWIHHAEHLKNDQADHAVTAAAKAARKSTEVGRSVGRSVGSLSLG